NRHVAHDGQQDRRGLRAARHQKTEGQAEHGRRADRAWPSHLPRLLSQRLHQAIREVLDLSAQRGLLQYPGRLRSEEGAGPSRRGARKAPRGDRPIRRFPGPMAERACRLSAAPTASTAITVGTAKYPGIKIHDTRMIRLMEVLLHGGTVVSGWTTRQIHEAILTTFRIGANRYGLNQLR